MTLIEALRAGPARTLDLTAWRKLTNDAADALEEAQEMCQHLNKVIAELRLNQQK